MKNFAIVGFCMLFLSYCANTPKVEHSSQNLTAENYAAKGQKIALETFATLSSNLQKAMKEGSVSNAVKYCNIAAAPLVDSLEQIHHVNIKRTSLKVRNPNNEPTEEEKQQLQKYQEQFNAGQALEPVVSGIGEKTVFFAPIHVMPLCQKCHGTLGAELMSEDYATIQGLYPLDRAIDYKSGDLRGMWSITFYEK